MLVNFTSVCYYNNKRKEGDGMARDVAKRWKNGNIRVACIGFENQTASDPNMPLRVMGYDGAEYRA